MLDAASKANNMLQAGGNVRCLQADDSRFSRFESPRYAWGKAIDSFCTDEVQTWCLREEDPVEMPRMSKFCKALVSLT